MKIRTFALAAILLATTGGANAATVIGFGNFDLSGNFGGNGRPITTYSESGFTVSAPAGQYAQQTNGVDSSDNNLLTGQGFNGALNALLTITGPSAARFISFAAATPGFSNDSPSGYTVTGYTGATQVFTYSGTIAPSSSGFVGSTPQPSTYSVFSNPFSASVDRVTIATSAPGQLHIDNLTFDDAQVAAVPEPATWAMMLGGFGIAGVALRRRRAAAVIA